MMNEAESALCLNLVSGIGPKIFGSLLEHFGSATAVLAIAPSELRVVSGVSQNLARSISTASSDIDIRPQLKLCADHQIDILDQTHLDYPTALKEIYDPPTI